MAQDRSARQRPRRRRHPAVVEIDELDALLIEIDDVVSIRKPLRIPARIGEFFGPARIEGVKDEPLVPWNLTGDSPAVRGPLLIRNGLAEELHALPSRTIEVDEHRPPIRLGDRSEEHTSELQSPY